MFPKIGKQIITAALPKGSAWTPSVDEGLDLTYEAIGQILDLMNEKLVEARVVRSPLQTNILNDLEKEYGIVTNELIDELTRRTQLDEKKKTNFSNASADFLQLFLNNSGFDIQVHRNDPPVDPAIFLDQSFIMVAGGGNAFAGRVDAFAGNIGGYLLVNGPLFNQSLGYAAQAGGTNTVAGNNQAVAGFFTTFVKEEVEYDTPVDPDVWGFVFFVGGDAERNGAGELTSIETAQVESQRRVEFETAILAIKPMFTWGGIIIDYN